MVIRILARTCWVIAVWLFASAVLAEVIQTIPKSSPSTMKGYMGGPPVVIDDPQVEAIAKKIDQWVRDVEFTSTYRLKTGQAASLALGLQGKFLKPVKPDEIVEATGVFHKFGPLMRCSLEYPGRPELMESTPSTQSWRNISQDTVVSGQLSLHYEPRGGAYVGGARLEKQGPLPGFESGAPMRAIANAYQLNPLRIMPDMYPNTKSRLVAESPTVLRIETTTSTPDLSIVQRIWVSTASDPPVITKLASNETLQGHKFEHHVQFSDFFPCPGGLVARTVRTVSQGNLKGGLWLLQEWHSDDLGSHPPTQDDFVLTLPAGVPIVGLLDDRAPSVNTERKVGPAMWTVRDLDKYGTASLAARKQRAAREQFVWTIAAASGLIVAIVFVALFATRRDRPSTRRDQE